jgi:hypothetical protein
MVVFMATRFSSVVCVEMRQFVFAHLAHGNHQFDFEGEKEKERENENSNSTSLAEKKYWIFFC